MRVLARAVGRSARRARRASGRRRHGVDLPRPRPSRTSSCPARSSTTISAAAPGTSSAAIASPRYSRRQGAATTRRLGQRQAQASRLRNARSMVSTLPARLPSARRTVSPRLKMAWVPRWYSPSGMPAAATASVTQWSPAAPAAPPGRHPRRHGGSRGSAPPMAARASAAPAAPACAVMQAGHGVEQMGEAGSTRGQCRAGLRVAAGGVADLGAGAEPAKGGQQGAVGVDLRRVGGDADRGQGRELLQQGRSGGMAKGGCAPSASGLMNGPSRCAPRTRAHRARCCASPRRCRAWRARRSSAGAVTVVASSEVVPCRGVEPRHVANRVGTVHAVGAVAAMHMEVDEARDDEPVVGCRARLDAEDLAVQRKVPPIQPTGVRMRPARLVWSKGSLLPLSRGASRRRNRSDRRDRPSA